MAQMNTNEHKDVALENHSPPLDAYASSGSLTGPTLNLDLKSKRATNRVRIYVDVTTGGTVGVGTSPLSTLLQTLYLYRGTQMAHSPDFIFKADNATLIYEAIITAIRSSPSIAVSAVAQSFRNEVLAGNAQYKFMVDLALNLPPGSYYAALVMNPITVLAGYGTSPVTMTTNFGIELMNEGQFVTAFDTKAEIVAEATSTQFSRAGVNEVFIICATELSTVSTITWDGAPVTAVGIRANESDAALRAGAGITLIAGATLPFPFTTTNPALAAGTAIYVLWLTKETTTSIEVKNSAATTMFVATFK